MIRLALLALAVSSIAVAQDNSNADRTIPFSVRSDLPGTCKLGQVITRKDLTPGSNVYICGTTNNWVPLGGGGAPSGTAAGTDISGTYPSSLLVSKITGATNNSTVNAPLVLNIGPDSLTSIAQGGYLGMVVGYKGCCTDIGTAFVDDVTDAPAGFPALFFQYETYDANASPQEQQIGYFGLLSNSDGTGHQVFQSFNIHDYVDNANLASFCYGYAAIGVTATGNNNCVTPNVSQLGEFLVIRNSNPSAKTSVGIADTGNELDADKQLFAEDSVGLIGNWWITHGGMLHEKLHTPASSSEACTAGDVTDDTGFHYVCTSTNTWKRVALSSF